MSGRMPRRVASMVLPALLLASAVLAFGHSAGKATGEAGAVPPGGSSRAVLVAAAAVPGAPTLDELDPADREIQVNWSFGNPNLGVTGYTATAQPGGLHCDAPGRFSTQCTITGLTNGVLYTVTVVAHHLSDGDSQPSNSLTATPNRHLKVTAVNPSERRVTVMWDLESIDPPQQFVVTLDSDPERRCTVNDGSTCDVELVPYGTHSARVTAVYADPAQNLTSEPQDFTLTPPDFDVAITGVAVSGNDATISWSHPGGSGSSYQAILFDDPALTCEFGAGFADADPSCTIADVPYGTHQVQVDAYSEGLDATSQIFTFLVAPPAPPDPTAPDDVTAAPGVSSIIASWSAPNDSDVPITGYRATASPGPASCTTTGATTCVIGGTAGQPYTITVVALSAGGGESMPSERSNTATPTLPVPADTPPATNLKLTTTEGRITTAQPGQDIVFVGNGFAAHSTVVFTIYSSHQILGTTETDGNGAFRSRVTVPANLAAGWHTVVALGISPDGTTRALAISIRFLGLAMTGTDVAAVLLVGLAMLGAGATAYAITRRRARRLRFVA